jgi:hypothetical protein
MNYGSAFVYGSDSHGVKTHLVYLIWSPSFAGVDITALELRIATRTGFDSTSIFITSATPLHWMKRGARHF